MPRAGVTQVMPIRRKTINFVAIGLFFIASPFFDRLLYIAAAMELV